MVEDVKKTVQRKPSYRLHVIAFFLTVGVFVVGILVGIAVNQSIMANLGQKLDGMAMERIQTIEFLILVSDSNDYCEFFQNKLDEFDEETFLLGQELEYLEYEKGVKDFETKSNYSFLELRNYLLEQKINELCGKKTIPILYFYSDECKDCIKQGFELTDARINSNGIIRVYSFDASINSQIVEQLLSLYSVKKYPTLIVEGSKVEQFVNANQINKLAGLSN